ncbi:unnamed protein product [Chironomus riparius]|uniref:Uncharacterized protein n=1 Tax=Chironomus riparius TaxID=315576 RepID=A0A9N9RSV3_9DIPT|nr:unnamed protein product [Chironomus riparius]
MDVEKNESDNETQEEQQHKLPIHHHHHQFQHRHEHLIKEDSSKENLSKVLRNIATIRRQQQETSVKSVQGESFTSSSVSSTQKMVTTMQTIETSSSKKETTGGTELFDDVENTNEVKSMMDLSACPIGRTMFAQQKQQQQQSIASSSMSTMSSTEAVKRTKTLSFLHNEDILSTLGTLASSTMLLPAQIEMEKSPTQTSLFRSMSFQERRQYQQQVSLKRVESGKELKAISGVDNFNNMRKVTILSPKHSLHELNERIKHLQQQMYGSSESSL